ncbi:MAG: hypothetical protein QGG36_06085 [Pirellulaceae bacterium]|jgi:transcription elongation factor Elf1|nr:hypothetical protein [Pirellulaceae bacterium]MDP7015346.1 hypothetical protein [Pirellulaceae bacterium]
MKGPHERLKYDLRRLFECPVCGHKERREGSEPTALCKCQQKEPLTEQRVMKLIGGAEH